MPTYTVTLLVAVKVSANNSVIAERLAFTEWKSLIKSAEARVTAAIHAAEDR